jgi:putative NIF3 family GTP cyclohydrolase 1 type 2
MQRDDLVRWLDAYLKVDQFKDPSLNGLQVEGKAEVRVVGAAVDAAQASLTRLLRPAWIS